MDKELLAALAAFFALKPDATEEDVKTALKDQKPLAEQLAAKDSEIAALKEASDPAKFAPMELVEAQTTQIASLTKKLSDLEKKTEETGLDAEITAALADGRLPKSCEGWARKMATERPSALREFLKVSVAPAALTNMQTNGQHISDEGVASLTEDEKFACRVTGVSEEDFLAQKKKEAK